MSHFLIMNPASQDGRSGKRFHVLHRLMKKCGLEYDFEQTRCLDHARQLCIQAHESGYDAIIAVGGDGTINSVLNGFYTSDGRLRSKAVMGAIHTGTSPDFCKSYGIPTAMASAVRLIAEGSNKKIYPGKITHAPFFDPANNGRFIEEIEHRITSYFGCCANLGIGVEIASRANSGIRGMLGDFLGTLVSTIGAIANYEPANLLLRIDGLSSEIEEVASLSVGRTRYIASGIKIANELGARDNRFYLLTLKHMNTFRWTSSLIKAYGGKPFQNTEYLTLSYCESISIAGNPTCPQIEFDGDPGGDLPALIELSSEPLTLIAK